MIKIIAGGKKHTSEYAAIIHDYEKRLRKPWDITWEFVEEEKLAKKLASWPFDRSREFVICCDERGENITSREFSDKLYGALSTNRDIVILIGGAYGFDATVREKADFVWSFSRLVFPHMIARLIATEQIYRASEITKGSAYHHE